MFRQIGDVLSKAEFTEFVRLINALHQGKATRDDVLTAARSMLSQHQDLLLRFTTLIQNSTSF